MLTIKNYQKIRGLAYYTDGKWHPLTFTHQKEGAIAHIDLIEETTDKYHLRLIYINPQPYQATITIWRKDLEIGGTRMWQVDIHKKGQLIVTEYWIKDQYEMQTLLESIKVYLIY